MSFLPYNTLQELIFVSLSISTVTFRTMCLVRYETSVNLTMTFRHKVSFNQGHRLMGQDLQLKRFLLR